MLRRKPIKKKTPAEKRARTLRKRRLGKEPVARSAVAKGPARDESHLAKVRRHPCIAFPVPLSEIVRQTVNEPISHAHHVRCIAPRSMGKRVSDYLAVPLCVQCHAALHGQNETEFWRTSGVDPRDFIRSFSPEGAAALAELERAAP